MSRRLCSSVVGVLVALMIGCGDGVSSPPSPLLDLSGRRVNPLRETDAKAIIFFFVRTDCPISNRYAPEVRRLHWEFSSRGARFYLVYVDPHESPEAIRTHLKEYNYPCPALRDPQHCLVRQTGVRVTPEAAVFRPDGKMVYRGRIDNQYVDFGKARPAPTRHDLQEVLEAILAGQSVKQATTDAVGCFIADLR